MERAASLERPIKPEEETVAETHNLAMILRVKRQGGWGLEGIPVEAFNQQTVKWKVQQVTGIEPIRAEIVTDLDVVLEFPNDALVTQVGREMQDVIEWGGYDVRVTGLMAKKTVVEDVAQTRKEMVERLRRQERDARRVQEAAQQEHVLLTGILARIDEQGRANGCPSGSDRNPFPEVSSSIVTPTPSAVGAKKNSKPPSLPIFSGEQPTPRGEAEYQQWVFQVRSFHESYTDEAIKNAVIANCRGRANTIVRAKGFDADLGDIIERLDKQFGVGQAGNEILREFHQMIQGSKGKCTGFWCEARMPFWYNKRAVPGVVRSCTTESAFFPWYQ